MCYEIIVDPEVVHDVFKDKLPFNLKNELKKIRRTYGIKREEIEEFLGDESRFLKKDLITYYHDKYVAIAKLRYANKSINKGKSGGLRLIFMIDYVHKYIILLSVYSKSDKDELSTEEQNKIKILAKKYKEDIVGGRA